MLLDNASALEKSEFLEEIEFMKGVGSDKNICTMLACCTRGDQVLLIVEYAQHGDLLSLLKEKRNKTYVKVGPANSEAAESTSDEQQASMENVIEEMLSFSWQIAKGMEYLASKGIVHRDLAARNVLVAEGLAAKVADFGLSRNVTYATKLYQAHTSRRLPIRWMSPEALNEQIFTTKSDVWSYGVVLWEIFSFGKLPYHGLLNEQLWRFLKKGQRMEKPDLCPDEIYGLMLGCWNEQPDDRPTFSDIIKSLETLMTRGKPYVELVAELTEGGAGYMVPVDNSDVESDNDLE